ncbi:hypothetical protein H4R33_003922 [Dimargaris cristalligena]|uniref:S-adenosyl-L-methionine-dependent methyltransferase n=1 Tax=Dimargaris cristalligena TaxID=215637 RepID=A0A4P9ZTD4_9FUNG|nr:hypothetical protein H4R33_003922 [Dimargaris cristalligena]RKP36834.1 S-adenosyl-L-methionine-dependent methyltransferase [Dimargaris cristalligena]|eukprot:RKP36834.1 S-adenosyl-L-methionine-dependent methyltransferase [Dimargaris cristalligena]
MDTLPKSNTEYGTKTYWEERYTREGSDHTFDWFKTYRDLLPIFEREVPDKSGRVLMLGAGNSTLSEDMYRDGYHHITNIDFSETVIDQMRQRCADLTEMEWEVMDIRELQLADASFDLVVDKGTMDALMCEQGDVWDPSEELMENVRREVDEALRVLKVGGKFIYITFGQPHFRSRHLKRDAFHLEIHTIGDAFHYFVYICTKINPQESTAQ